MHITRFDVLPIAAKTTDFSFEIEGIVVPPFESVPLQTEPVGPRLTKEYGIDESLFEAHDGQERALFTCLAGTDLAGYVSVSRGWNGCAMIDDIAVARPFRRRRIAGRLLDEAITWARAAGLGSVRLETQSNNVAACRFYHNYGFELGGYDRFLYREIGPEKQEEIALFWYLKLR